MPRAHRFFKSLLILPLMGTSFSAFADDGYAHIEIADCHVHLLDFLQNGDFYADGKFIRGGTANQPQRPAQRIEAFLKMMDYAHVSEAMVMGMPFVKKWSANGAVRGGCYLDSDSRVVFARDTDYTIGEAMLDVIVYRAKPLVLRGEVHIHSQE